jgi:PrtD family type I secretion system ABC transporter
MNQKQSYFQKLYQACRGAILTIGIFSFFVNLLMLVVPIYMLQLFDRVIPGFSYDTLLYITMIAILALVVLGGLDLARSHVLVRVAHWFDQKVSSSALERIPDQVVSGNISALERLRDSNRLKAFLTNPLILVIFDAPWSPIFLAVIFLLHPALGFVAAGGAVILFTLGLSNDIATRKLHMESSESAQKSETHVMSALRNAESIQAMGMMPNIMQRWFRDNEHTLKNSSMVGERNSAFRSMAKSLRLILQLLILGVGAYLVLEQSITAGTMIAASILMSRALAPIEQAVSGWRAMLSAKEAYLRLKQYFATVGMRQEGMALPEPKGKISVEDLNIIHPERKAYILNHIKFDLEPGEVLVILGPSAAGKTTLARTMMGIIKPHAGNVRLDDADVYTWERENFGKYVGYMSQGIEFFSGSIKENIARMGDANPAKVIVAAKIAGVHEMILHLPDGYDTLMSEQNRVLSGGQLQRIALARAFYNEPKFVVLDEPNASLDESGLKALQECIQQAKDRGTTIVVITHAPSLVKLADKVLILKNGCVAMFDDRDTVMQKLNQVAQSVKRSQQEGVQT